MSATRSTYHPSPQGPRSGGYGHQRGEETAIDISVEDLKLAPPVSVHLFAETAEQKAATIFQAGRKAKNKSTQLRKFYDELLLWHDKVHRERTSQARADKYGEVAPFIRMMKAKVAYARARDHVDPCFEKLFSHLIGQIGDVETLRNAKLFMEAFMGFYKAQEK